MVEKLRAAWQSRRGVVTVAAVLAVATASFGVARILRTDSAIPTAEVQRGEFVDWVQLRGEVKALQSAVLTAPSGAGDIQIIKLTPNGHPVKKGEAVVRFDTTALQTNLDQRRSEWKQAEAEIEGARAQSRLAEEQDQTGLVRARYDVERARLDTTKAEVISEIEAGKNRLNLGGAEQRVREVEQKQASDKAGAAADIEIKKQKRDKALFEVKRAERNIAAMTLVAQVDGLITLLPNWRARGGFGGGAAPEFKEGDRAWPGAAVAELPNLATLHVSLRVDETDRGRLALGQTARVRVDAVPDKEFPARVEEIGALAKPDFSGWPPTRNFDIGLQLTAAETRLRPGMSATARVAVERTPDAILIPAEAVFSRGGRTVAYVRRGSEFDERVIAVARRSAGRVLVARGLNPGEHIALKDPRAEERK